MVARDPAVAVAVVIVVFLPETAIVQIDEKLWMEKEYRCRSKRKWI